MHGKASFRKALFLAGAALLVVSAAEGTETDRSDNRWVLAASKFDAQEIPESFSPYAEAVPLMVLQRLSGSFTRNVPPAEAEARALAEYQAGLNKLIAERSELVLARDKILFDAVSDSARAKRRAAAENKIKTKELAISKYQKENTRALTTGTTRADALRPVFEARQVSLWESGNKLFDSGNSSGFGALEKAGIDALITGTLEDASGYLVVTLRMDTGLEGVAPAETKAAGAYEDLDRIIDILASSVKTTFSYVEAVTLKLALSPPDASVYLDGAKIPPGIDSLVIPSGSHRIEASAVGYTPTSQERLFSGSPTFLVSITLEREALVETGFTSSVVGSLIYLETAYVGETPLQASLSPRISLGLAIANEIPTWFYVDASQPSPAYSINANPVKTKTLVEKRRSVLYWSLGALYVSLPIAMLTNGVFQDKLRAYNAEYLPADQRTYDDIKGWETAYRIGTGVSVGLGVNYIVQLVRYLLAAERALPQRAEPHESIQP